MKGLHHEHQELLLSEGLLESEFIDKAGRIRIAEPRHARTGFDPRVLRHPSTVVRLEQMKPIPPKS
jgi:hypothetical protein